MAKFTFNMPDVGEGVAEAEVTKWHVKPGDRVEEDQPLVDVMTDKATIDIESPVAGTVLELSCEEGETVAVGAMLLVLEVEGEVEEAPSDSAGEAKKAPPPASQSAKSEEAEELVRREEERDAAQTGADDAGDDVDEKAPSTSDKPAERKKVLASPAVRQRARELGIDLALVKPSSDGRIRHRDLDAFLLYNGAQGYAPAGPTRPDETVKVIGLRKRIAQNMAASKRRIPHFTYVEECDVTALEALRAELNAHRGERPKLTMLPLLITAICRALPDYPMINARYDDEAGIVTRHGAVHMGIATQTDRGLMVPVLRDAQARNLWQLAAEIRRLAEAARDGSATSEELSGSTLTITSLGPLGGVATTPVINRPEVAIIGPNRIIERPVFVPDGLGGERIEKRKLMNISISCDHRVVDGYDAASFIQAVKTLIESPAAMLAD